MKIIDAYDSRDARLLFDGRKVSPFLDFETDGSKASSQLAQAMHRISVSGVQEKFPAIVDKGRIRLTKEGEQSTHILKPAPWDETLQNRRLIPINENLTMQIASQAYKIRTAANGLCFAGAKRRPVYITRRFDILSDNFKMPMEDFASALGRNEDNCGEYFKYTGCYADIAAAIRKNVAAWMVDMERFFELVVFNYIYANGDAHLKNFSIILDGEDYRLAPAYDLLNTSLHVASDDFALEGGLSRDLPKSDVYSATGHPCRCDFEAFGQLTGLNGIRIKKILDKYMSIPDAALNLIKTSLLDDKSKRQYFRIISERTSRFNR